MWVIGSGTASEEVMWAEPGCWRDLDEMYKGPALGVNLVCLRTKEGGRSEDGR